MGTLDLNGKMNDFDKFHKSLAICKSWEKKFGPRLQKSTASIATHEPLSYCQ